MEIILQDMGHASLHLVGRYLPREGLVYDSNVALIQANQEYELDAISFIPPDFNFNRWRSKPVSQPKVFHRRENFQTVKLDDGDDFVRGIWAKGRAMASYVSFNLPQRRSDMTLNILTDFNCYSGAIACSYEMGFTLEGLRGDAGTKYDFSQIGLDF
ncbi:MAG: hypothetical protein AB8B83_08075 [Bdellovibrionales bacterium]